MMLLALVHILSPVVLAIVVNTIIYAKGWNKTNLQDPLAPPSWFIATTWTILLAILGYVAWLTKKDMLVYTCVLLFIMLCLMYPFYPRGIRNTLNKVTLLAAVILTILIFFRINRERQTIYYLIPLLLWLSYVNVFLTR